MTNRIFIDVREVDEFQSDHYAGAINIPLSRLSATPKQALKDLSVEYEIIVYCRSGGRASMAVKIIKDQGYDLVYNGINQQQCEQKYE